MISEMSTQSPSQTFWHKIGGYILIPHELLHVLAYRLIGKLCSYEWGAYQVRSLQSKNRTEKLFVLLFPFVTCVGLGFLFGLLWLMTILSIDIAPNRYFVDGPTWHLIFLLVGTLCILYSGTAHQDLIEAYGWLFVYQTDDDDPKPQHHPDESQPERHSP